MKKLTKWMLAALLYYSGGLFLYRRAVKPLLARHCLIILRYHRILGKDTPDAVNISITKDSFEKQMRYIRKHFKILSIPEIVDKLERNEKFDKPTIGITFDDGYKNNYTYAYPILKRFSIPATIFLTVDYVDKDKIFPWDKEISKYGDIQDTAMLNWQDIAEMAKGGIYFGSHTLTHPKLAEINFDDAKREIFESGRILREKLGKEAITFSYPHGNFGGRIKDLVKEAGYKAAFSTRDGFYSDNPDLFALKRKAIHEGLITNPFGRFSRCLFALEIDGVFDWLLPFRGKNSEIREESSDKKNILFLINGLSLAGAEKHLYEVVKSIDKSKFRPIVCCLFFKGDNFESLKGYGVDVRFLNIKRIYGISGLIGLISLVNIMRQNRIDIIHAQLFSENIFGAIAARIAGVKAVITSRRDTGVLREGKFRHILAYRFTNRWVDKIVCVSNAVRRVVLEKECVSPDKVEVIYNGVGLTQYSIPNTQYKSRLKEKLGIKDDELVVGMIANLSWIKGHREFIEAAKLVAQEAPNVKFVLVGDGPLLEGYKLQVTSDKLKDKTLFLGKRQDIPELLSIMDISVNASYSEGMSNTVLESMAAGVPVVATAVDGNLETVVDGATGLLVPPRDSKALAEAIVRLLKDQDARRRMRAEGRRTIEEKFTAQKMLSQFENLYMSLTKPKIAYILSQFPETHETFILREIKAMQEKGVDISILSLKRCRDKIIHPEARKLMKETTYGKVNGVRCTVYGLMHPIRVLKVIKYVIGTYWNNPRELMKAMYVLLECFYFAGVLKKRKITHIHSHWATMPTTAAMILNKLTGVQFSFTAHAWDIFISQRGLREKIEKAKFVVTCTDHNRRYLINLTAIRYPCLAGRQALTTNKIYLNYHGLEQEWFAEWGPGSMADSYTLHPNPFRLLAIGRLVEQKGFEHLIEACALLRDREIDFECNIVGEGPLKRQLELTANRYTLNPKVKFLGMKTQEEIKQLYRESDVFVAPSVIAKNGDRDGIPNVLIEAMAMGVPVVATSVSGIPEIVIDQKTGILVPPRNNAILADAIEWLWKNPSLREKFAVNSRKLIEQNFSTDKNIDELLGIFQENGIYENRKLKMENRKKRINVLYIIWSLGLGGAERVVINLAKGLDRSKYNPMVCCLNDKGPFAQELEDLGIKVLALNKRGKFDFSILHSLSSIFKKYNIQVVHTHLWGANLWGRLAAIKAKVPVIIAQEHGVEMWRGRFHFWLDKKLYKRTSKLIFVSEASRELFLSKAGVEPQKCKVIYNGIDTNNFNKTMNAEQIRSKLDLNSNDFVIAVIGRLVKEKGHEYFLDAFAKVKFKNSLIKALIVGDGPLRQGLRKRAERLGLNGSVRFLGQRNDVPDILKASDLLVQASIKEALPLTLLEGLVAGKPIIATDVGGTKEIIADNDDGMLVQPANSGALAEAIAKLIENNELQRRAADNGLRTIEEKFSMKKWINSVESLYEEALKEK